MRRMVLLVVVGLAVAVVGGNAALSLQESAPAPADASAVGAEGATTVEAAAAPAESANPHAATVACDNCHVSANPTPGQAELKACPRPKSAANGHSDTEAPDVIHMNKLSQIYVGVLFPHKLHAEMTEMGGGCETCHHLNPEGPILACGACHGGPSNPENLEQPGLKGAYHRQCLGCHREWTHETDCGVCHVKRVPGQPEAPKPDPTDIMGQLHPNIEVPDLRIYKNEDMADTPIVTFHHKQHVELFGIKCTACHREENCSRCHDGANHKARVRQDPHEDCMQCHEKELGDNCAYCHTAEPSPGFDHERVAGIALQPFHEAVQCRKCHGGELRMEPVAKTECSECHAPDWAPAEFDHAKTGHPLDELHVALECKDCHAQGLGKPAACDGCHDDGRKSFEKPAQPVEEAPVTPAEETAAPPPATPAA